MPKWIKLVSGIKINTEKTFILHKGPNLPMEMETPWRLGHHHHHITCV